MPEARDGPKPNSRETNTEEAEGGEVSRAIRVLAKPLPPLLFSAFSARSVFLYSCLAE
jgi:hypothetical protein